MSGVLAKIAAKVRERTEERRAKRPLEALVAEARAARKPHDFEAPFRENAISVIAEVKLKSPSEGAIAEGADPVTVARGYLEGGAAALSILTEEDYFGGSPAYLERVRAAHPEARLLRKDFIVDPYQIFEARALGADAVLLIVALLGEAGTRELLAVARDLGLAALVEVHDEAELSEALAAGATLIGVNNRNLKTLEVSLTVSERLAGLMPRDGIAVAESGLKTADDLKRLAALGYRGFLIGTHFMRSGRPGEALRDLLREARA
jgi:indole-3-glycerol phosphate synthase